MKRCRPNLFLTAALGVLAMMFASGCDRDGVKVYHVDTNAVAVSASTPPPISAPSSAPDAMRMAMPNDLPAPDNSGLPKLKYTVPAGWTEKKPSQMRVASFDVSQNGKSVDVSVVPLGGMAGGDFANVNRWRGQLQLQPIDDGSIQQLAEKVQVGVQSADLYDLTGGSQRIIAVIAHQPEAVWFFKMTGDADLVEQQKPAFIAFLKSGQFGAPAAATPMDATQLPPSHPPIGDMGGSTGAAADNAGIEKPTWTVPGDWQVGPASQFLVAKYIITGTNGAGADVNISTSANDGGGLAANVNRWRGQLGLPAEADMASASLSVGGDSAKLVDLSGTDARNGKAARLIGVLVTQGAQTWFYKLMGDPGLVTQQKDAFTQFVQSAKYPDVH